VPERGARLPAALPPIRLSGFVQYLYGRHGCLTSRQSVGTSPRMLPVRWSSHPARCELIVHHDKRVPEPVLPLPALTACGTVSTTRPESPTTPLRLATVRSPCMIRLVPCKLRRGRGRLRRWGGEGTLVKKFTIQPETGCRAGSLRTDPREYGDRMEWRDRRRDFGCGSPRAPRPGGPSEMTEAGGRSPRGAR